MQAAKLGSRLFYYLPLLRSNNMATKQIFKGSFKITVVGVLTYVTVERRHHGRQCSVKQ